MDRSGRRRGSASWGRLGWQAGWGWAREKRYALCALATGVTLTASVLSGAARADLTFPKPGAVSPKAVSPKAGSSAAGPLKAGPAAATTPENKAAVRSGEAVATVGTATVRAAEVEQIIESIPPYQLKRMGPPAEVARVVTENVVEDLLAELGARADGLDRRKDVAERTRSIYASALLQDARASAAEASVTDEEIEAYYRANRARYRAELRIRVWQIVVGTKAEADAILAQIQTDPGYASDPVEGWSKLARAKSLDKGTAMRRGDLGFVRPDGSTPHRDVAFPPEVYTALVDVGDGEVLSTPVQIGEDWLVLQRRGSVTTPERTLEQERKTIRGLLSQQKVKEVASGLVARLRAQHLRNHHPERVDVIEIDPEGDLAAAERPGSLRATRVPDAPVAPEGPPGNLR